MKQQSLVIMAFFSMTFFSFLCLAHAEQPAGFTADVTLSSPGDTRQLSRLQISIESVRDRIAHVWIDEREMRMLRRAGFRVVRTLEPAFSRLSRDGLAAGYHTPDTCVADFKAWAQSNPEVARYTEIGKSVKGRPIVGLKITTDPDQHGFKPLVRICGAHHGNEVGSSETVILFTKYLLDNYKTDARLRELVSSHEIWIVPMVNPDGVSGRTRYNANGKDLNRNYGYMWAGSDKSGSAPYSEPEVRAIRDFSADLPFSVSLSFHCSGDVINYLWNYTGVRSPDQDLILELSQGYQKSTGYRITEGYDWYETRGDTNDYSYGCRGDLDWTIEVANPAASGIGQVFDKNREAILYMIEQSNRGICGVVTDSQTGRPLESLVEPISPGWPTFTHPVGGDYHRILRPGTYKLRVWAPGHETKIIENVEVKDGPATRVDVALDSRPGTYAAWNIVTAAIPNDDDYRNKTHGPQALGPADGRFVSIGKGGWVVLDLGTAFPAGAECRLSVQEAQDADSEHEPYEVFTSNKRDGPWTPVGNGSGTATINVSSLARFVKILDKSLATANHGTTDRMDTGEPTTTPGFDLDAISVETRSARNALLFDMLYSRPLN